MGFYGNITNNAKTTFSFDKIYPNRNEADLGCASDGVMVGRYVLIEYDQEQSEDAYESLWCYDSKMYTGVNLKTMKDNSTIITSPIQKLEYEAKNTGQVVQVGPGRKAISLNKTPLYIQVTDAKAGEYTAITSTNYKNYLSNTYKRVTPANSDEWKPNFYYFLNEYYDNDSHSTKREWVLDAEFTPIKSEITSGDLAIHADIDGNEAGCGLGEEWWIHIEDTYAPIGHISRNYVDGMPASQWWDIGNRRRVLQNAVNIAMSDNFTYYGRSRFDSSRKYYLPLSKLFRPVDVTSYEYAPGAFYYVERLEAELEEGQKPENPTLIDVFKLDNSTTRKPNRRYFINGRAIDVYEKSSSVSNEKSEIIFSPIGDEVVGDGDCYRIDPGHSYTTNKDTEFWMFTGSYWKQVSSDNDMTGSSTAPLTYLKNFSIDAGVYKTNRGYDSTAWQKVFTNGIERYVMVAELNSVVPTFDIGTDAPSLIPVMPHFDVDSTNVYYKIHWQPQWGFRVKGANNELTVPVYNQDGSLSGATAVRARRQHADNEGGTANVYHTYDDVFYPSDEKVSWHGIHYDTSTGQLQSGFYNPKNSTWDSKNPVDLPAAIYYNKAGFDPDMIAYSADLLDEKSSRFNENVAKSGWKKEDKITVTPTGQSGNIYNQHDGTHDMGVSEDIQEMSIMLPSVGDSIAKVWDIVFGGRDTNDEIKNSGERNTDLSWEEGRSSLDRRGLRLVHELPGHNGNTYSKAEVNTIAGAINSAHDILGMIIQSGTEDHLRSNVDNLEDGKIYYDTTNKKYMRRHLSYDYTPITLEDLPSTNFTAVSNIKSDDFDPTKYWIKNASDEFERLPANATYDPNQTYYILHLDAYEQKNFKPFLSGKYYFMSKTNTSYDDTWARNPEMMNYTACKTFVPGHKYYTVDLTQLQYHKLNKSYKPNTFFVKDLDGNFKLDTNESATADWQYYTIDALKVVRVLNNANAGNYGGIYVPNYYYYQDETGAIQLDNNATMTQSRKYFLPTIKLAGKTEDGEEEDKVEEQIEYTKTYQTIPVVPSDRIDYEANVLYGQNSEEGTYYYIMDTSGNLIPYAESYDTYLANRPVLFYQKVIYVADKEEEKYTIDQMTQIKVTQFTMDTFYEQEIDDDGLITGYRLLYRYDIDPYDTSGKVIVAFGYGYGAPDENHATEWLKPWANAAEPFCIKADYDSSKIELIEEWACQRTYDFYVPGVYHFIDEDGSLILDTYYKMTRNDYFTIPKEAINLFSQGDGDFYEACKYYIATPYGYELAKESNPKDGTVYYERKQLYVVEDTTGAFKKGTPWPSSATEIPSNITLGTRTDKYELKELPGFARDLNTMHGMLLKLNKFMEYDDTLTRDERIANGLLNKLKDIIFGLERLTPEQFFIVDNFGRAHSADWDTRQSDSYTNLKNASKSLLKDIEGDKFANAANVNSMRNQWITANIDGDPVNPKITIHHNFQSVTDTNTVSNKNGGTVSGTAGANHNTNDTLTLYTPIVDAMGHVVGKNVETVTLPYNFKTVTPGAASTAVTGITANTNAITATNTKDGFTFTPGNKWLQVAASEKVFTIAHAVPGLTAGAANTGYGASMTDAFLFKVPTLTVDEAGHTTAIGSYDITLPENFKTISTTLSSVTTFTATHATGSVSPATLTDTLILAEGNRWINIITDATNKKFTFEHAAAGTASISKGDTTAQTPDFGSTFKVLSAGIDQAGHVASLEEHDVTIPLPSLTNGTGQIVTGLSLIDSTGAFTETKANLGTIALTGYTLGTDNTAIAETDTLNDAISKLENQVIKEAKDRDTAIEDAINALDFTEITAATGQVIDKISQVDGTISASFRSLTKDDIPTIDNTQVDGLGDLATKNEEDLDMISSTDTFEYTVGDVTQSLTIAELVSKIAELEARLAALEPTTE